MVNTAKNSLKTPATLSFYTELPITNLTHETFKEFCKKRMHVLKQIESNKHNDKFINQIINCEEFDLISYASLKLICSTTFELSKWFINMECKLFKQRLESMSNEDIKSFFIKKIWIFLNINNNKITHETHFDLNNNNINKIDWNIEIYFSKCSDYLYKRIYKLEYGYYKLNDVLLKSFIMYEFRNYMEIKMNELQSKVINTMDGRFMRLQREIIVMEESAAENKIIKITEKENMFPLCIRGLINKFRKLRHIKYTDRQILCRFLKDIGVPMEDTIEFFKSTFKIAPELFNKEYLYSIKHNYGKVGKMANYKSFSCNSIIEITNDINVFGCPFINNYEFVKEHYDIEDIGKNFKNPIKACGKCGSLAINEEIKARTEIMEMFGTPAEYFKLIEKKKNEIKQKIN